jgi:tetratricopeptide (TPR) repeat protein
MDKKRVFLISVLLLTSIFVFGEYSDFYYQWAGFFYPNIDDNAGLTLFPSLFIPMGGEYEGMGTAFTAVARDSSFIESNPAASSTLPRSELAFLHHSWIMDSNLESVIYATRAGNFGFATSGKFLYVPFNEKDEWGRAGGKGYYLEAIGTLNFSYNLFSSYSFSGIAIGTNIKLAYMGIPESIRPNESVLTAMVDVGLLTRFNLLKFYSSREENFAIGLTFKNYSPLSTPDPLPTMATAGIAYSPIRPLLLAVDFNIPISLDPSIPAERVYLAGGFTLAFSPFIALQGGIKFKGGNPMLSLGTTIDLAYISFIVNYNLDLTNSLDPLDKFSIAAKFNLGDQGRASHRNSAEQLYLEGVDFYAKGDIEAAIGKWEKALEIDSSFSPARDYLAVAQKALKVKKEIVDKQKFD